MKLYEINAAIMAVTDRIAWDEETGEILCNLDEIYAELDKLEMQRADKLAGIAKVVLNTRAEAEALKAEEDRLKARRQRLQCKEERLLKILDEQCCGQKTDLGVATLSYRKTEKLDVLDAEKAIKWLKRKKLTDCFRIPAPEVAKAEVKKLIKSGQKIPGCVIVSDSSYSLR